MPTLEDINKIKSQLLETGHEPSILAERGEEHVDIELPEQGLPDDLNELFDDDFDLDEPEDLFGEDVPEDIPENIPEENTEDLFGEDIPEDLPGEGREEDALEEEPEDLFGDDIPDLPEDISEDISEGEPEEVAGDDVPDFSDMVPEAASLEEDMDEFSMDDTNILEAGFGAEEPDDEPDDEFALPDFDEETEEPEEIEVSPDVSEAESPGASQELPEEFDLSMDEDEEGIDLEEFEIADDEAADEDFEIDEFNLGDLGQDFGVLEESEDLTFTPREKSSEVSAELAEPEEEELYQISEEDFKKIKGTLNTLPRNLKIVIEEYIGEKNLSGEKLKRITDALIAGKSPKEIAAITGKVTGQKIKIPAQYEKRSGINFEEEKDSFSYIFRHTVLPLMEMVVLGAAAIVLATFLGYKFVYKPVYALVLYDKGYKQLEDNHYPQANEYFKRAVKQHVFKKQFFRYAEGFISNKQWSFAEGKYDQLLKFYPLDKKGTLDYARMEFKDLYNYEKASALLKKFLSNEKNITDYDALLLYGDVNLEWGGEDKNHYETARRAYARIMENYGVQNKILFRMMKYFIRTDDYKQVKILKLRFRADKDLKVDPAVYAELAAYQMKRNDLGDVKQILMRAKGVDPSLPEIHYQLARYFRKVGDTVEEDKALSQAMHYLKAEDHLSSKRTEELIDIYRRTGERAYARKEYIHAQEYYNQGIDLLNNSRKLSIVPPVNADYGKMFADLGDIYYFQSGELDKALSMYETAQKEEDTNDTRLYYKIGYIYYAKNNYKEALLNFYNAAGNFSTNTNLLYATANTLYNSNDLFMAQGYYNHLLDILESRLQAEVPLQLNSRSDQRKLLQDLIAATNNLGVTLYGLYKRTGKPEDFTQALVSFTESDDYYDRLTRNQETMVRAGSINLAFLNQKKLLYPVKGYTLQLYRDIPRDMDLFNFE